MGKVATGFSLGGSLGEIPEKGRAETTGALAKHKKQAVEYSSAGQRGAG